MAEQAIAARLTPLPVETAPLEQCIGRTLREDIYAERDNPPFDRVCMDGIAIASAAFARGVHRFRIQATQPAGALALTLADADNAVEVMTGAIMPRGTDCVIPLEEYAISDGTAALKADARGSSWRNVQRRGEDSRPGVPMLKAGVRLGAPEIAVAASAGLARVRVSRQPQLMVVSTGDELIEPGEPIAEHQVRRSNAYAIIAALREHGLAQVANDHLPDVETLLKDRLGRHLAAYDVLILSGGISKGKFDLVPKVLKELGVQEVFHQVAQRPGAPMWFGTTAHGRIVFGLPGNPVSTLLCLIRYVVPALGAAMGAPPTPPQPIGLAAPFKSGRPVTYFLPVAVRYDERGRGRAEPRPPNGSGDFLALAGTQGFVELPPRTEAFPEGFVADLYRW
ncbi:MAG: molybdopterin molybdotransferase MoeA [Steroidobacteraceae bacterium]